MGKNAKTGFLLRLDEPGQKLLTKLAKRHGGKTAALIAAMTALDGANEISRETLLAEIERRLK